MPKAATINTTPIPAPDLARVTPGRRGLLGGIAALAAAGGVTVAARAAASSEPASNADAELLALHRDFLVQDAVCDAWDAGEVSTEIGEAAHDRWWECIEAAEKMPVHTLAGLRAKADIALKGLILIDNGQSAADDLVRATLGDIAGWGALS